PPESERSTLAFSKNRDFEPSWCFSPAPSFQANFPHSCTNIAFLVPIKRMTATDTPSTNLRPVQLCGSLAVIVSLITIAVGTFQPSNADAYALEGPKWPNGSTVVMQL